MNMLDSADYNPAQQQLVDLLGAPPAERPMFDSDLRNQLRDHLEQRLQPLTAVITSDAFKDEALYLSKFKLNQVLGCERKFLAEDDQPFVWTPATARGTILHKAIELSVHWHGEMSPLLLVDEAMASLSNSTKGISDYLRTCGDTERTELRSVVGAAMTGFMECFPPLKPRWRPTTESPLKATFHGGLIVLSGKPDLMLGQPDGNVAGKVVIDFKTGRTSSSHREDLRFYALLESLRVLPPRLIATYYLDEGRPVFEKVSVDLLYSAAERVVDGAERHLELLTKQRPPAVAPGPSCRWCSIQTNCEEGTTYLLDEPETW